jgi:hypothetical protein
VIHVFGKVMLNELAVLSALRHNARLEALKSRRAAATASAASSAAFLASSSSPGCIILGNRKSAAKIEVVTSCTSS